MHEESKKGASYLQREGRRSCIDIVPLRAWLIELLMRSAPIAFSAVAFIVVLPCAVLASSAGAAVWSRRTHITLITLDPSLGSSAVSSARHLSLAIRGGGSSLEGPVKPQRREKNAKAGKSRKKTGTGAGDGLTQRMASNDEETVVAAAVPPSEERSNLSKPKPKKTGLSDSEERFESALLSLGLALGTGGTDTIETSTTMDADGEVETIAYYQCSHCNSIVTSSDNSRPMTLLADYIVRTNGGTHLVQTLLSLVAVSMGVACLLLPPFPGIQNNKSTTAETLSLSMLRSSTKYRLMQQTLLLGAVRFLVAMLGAINLSASRIRQLGLRNARRHLEEVALHPVGQCLFSCSLLVAWLNSSAMGDYAASMRGSVVSIMNGAGTSGEDGASTATTRSQLLDLLSQQPPPWFSSREYGGAVIPLLILGPLLLRETISIVWTFSDLISISVSGTGPLSRLASSLTSATRSILDMFMFVLFKSEDWRNADSFHRQKSLSRLVDRWSQLLEWAVGALLAGDAAHSFWTLAFVPSSSTGGNMTFKRVLYKAICANMYVSALSSRRRRIASSTPVENT